MSTYRGYLIMWQVAHPHWTRHLVGAALERGEPGPCFMVQPWRQGTSATGAGGGVARTMASRARFGNGTWTKMHKKSSSRLLTCAFRKYGFTLGHSFAISRR
ncbi:hypothetical protein [Streptomyces sp. NPDC048438]|uniref:hypothetical protein n=1 Tax=Streptomyces sp. NPDC048438 TaxID=3365551 RepID=UPI003722BC2E